MSEDFVIRIRADDAATATIKKIQDALGKVTAPVDKAQKRFANIGAVGQRSVEKLTKGLNSAARAAHTLVDKVVELVPGLAAIGAAGTVAGIVGLTSRFGSFGFALNKTSKLLGMNAQDLAAWHVAAKRAGVSAGEFDSAIASSQDAIRAAANGSNPAALVLMQKMGVQIQRNKDGSVDYYTTQMRLMRAIAGQRSAVTQRAAADAVGMGGLLPMLQQGTYGDDKARALRKGLVPTADELTRATRFKQDINDLEDSVSGLSNSIGARLVPILDPVVNAFAAWLDKNRSTIADQLAEAVQKFATWLSKIDWNEVAKKAKELWDNVGGLKGVLIAIAAVKLVTPIASVVSLITSLTKLTTATIPAAVGALGTLGTAGIAAWGALKVAEIAGLPNVDKNNGIDDVRKGDWLLASAHLPAGDFLRALAAKGQGKSNDEIATWLAGGQNPADNGNKQLPLGIRTNNPLNILHDGNQRTYATPEDGLTAAVRNLERGYQGLTIAKIADKWTGGARTGNTPQQMANYVSLLTGATGLGANDVPDLRDSSVVAKLIRAQIRAENGMQPYSDAQIDGAVGAGIASVPASNRNAAGSGGAQTVPVKISVDMKGVPQGARAEAKTDDGSYLPTRVEYRLDGIN
ncbi:hypothetical protein [Burkholderia glumae]|uniref:hypothetical protein n=1 Tax=Burkholderia glumae TaxID=337 RepID=UPI00054ABDDC|nr:hypothetical protein [Burkholderia glumae]KHJ62342.1 hypothetical protein NCPPB3923_14055 [Burkholderia glumae]UVT04576.1 hypothetical protein EFP20_25225 [Burkholderia glumae]